MNFVERIKHLWVLSAYEPGQATDETGTPGTEVAMIVKKPEKKKGYAVFVPYQKIDPIKQLVNEQPT